MGRNNGIELPYGLIDFTLSIATNKELFESDSLVQ